jgi:hypothetical protein
MVFQLAVEGSTNLLNWKSLGIGSNAFGRVPVHPATIPNVLLRVIVE